MANNVVIIIIRASSCAQLSNREHGIPYGPAAELPYRINNDRFSKEHFYHPDMQLSQQKIKHLDQLPVCWEERL